MENWQIWCFLGLAFIFFLGLFLIALGEEEEQAETYSQEELALLEFLETRQAVNEDFLKAQNQLLKELFDERRRF
ncbi:hypothetical protein BVE84_02275 [Streptococcus azizii]|uniref:Uncharacterized protein n=1 Tax=Streptococcus azizii TaxID=1579424 RepID=A0AB36JSS7_9STRE|nr:MULTISPECIES: hypothetical protein [Streptococcus]MBF0775355.1 hypothetical protein [Streptococcus sp. 19428wD3_AN2]ONK29625.1 hypothetical protein BVE86_00965 [Streptococcus azizii]ONK30133.1 hypothetical protein BVE85_02275 [Streptococcus azizii]ONK30909.1 hypothetical protein BVE84_02275 [Streptococcus azizii]TFU84879.1 hypothetical protein E4T83_00975 [Streptococcus sp. AN2]